ncbi:hypothetical protein ACVWZ6_002227 [Bradyrhizobium sp. GM6.1]
MSPERPRHIRQLQIEFTPAIFFPCAEFGTRECILDRVLQVVGVFPNDIEGRQGGSQIDAIGAERGRCDRQTRLSYR